jgi:hypothetical protein
MLPKGDVNESLKQSLKKFLIISLVSCMEYFFRSEAKYLVDNNSIDISGLVSGDITFSIKELELMLKDGHITRGNILASSYNFSNLSEINKIYSNLLGIEFLDYVIKLNDIDQARYVLKGRPIPIDYSKLISVTRLRNEVVHDLKPVNISNWGILSLWDNLMNIMDISVVIFLSVADKELKTTLDADYQDGIERQKRKDLYNKYCLLILKSLHVNGPIESSKEKIMSNLLNILQINTQNNYLLNNVDRIVYKMFKLGLIAYKENKISITTKGMRKLK